jgi:hypothetical protein
MQQIWILLVVSLLSTTICHAAPQGDVTNEAEGSAEAGDDNAAADLTEATDLMTFLKMSVK